MATAATGRQRYQWLLLLLVAAILLVWMLTSGGRQDVDPEPSGGGTTTSPTTEATDDTGREGGTDLESGLPIVHLSALPPEAARTLELIDAGGPFPEPDRDGGTFQNREDLLPDQPMGYYREYTVPTPGSDDRGARRIVAGEGGELYYTGDHYRSFSRIARPS